MPYAYGGANGWGGWTTDPTNEHETTRLQKDQFAQQQQAAMAAQQQAVAAQQEQHERSLQSQEQQRRQYDSQTSRMGQQQKFNVLGNLLGAPRRIR